MIAQAERAAAKAGARSQVYVVGEDGDFTSGASGELGEGANGLEAHDLR